MGWGGGDGGGCGGGSAFGIVEVCYRRVVIVGCVLLVEFGGRGWQVVFDRLCPVFVFCVFVVETMCTSSLRWCG